MESDDPEIKSYIIEVSNDHMRAILTNVKLLIDSDAEVPTWNLKTKPKDEEEGDEDLGHDEYDEEEADEEEEKADEEVKANEKNNKKVIEDYDAMEEDKY